MRDIDKGKILSIYLKFVIRSLKDQQKSTFLKHFIPIMEDKKTIQFYTGEEKNSALINIFNILRDDCDLYQTICKIIDNLSDTKFENPKKSDLLSNDYEKPTSNPLYTLTELHKIFNLKNVFTDKF